jgi:peptidyl-prolyl cis-trans isomerase D
VLDLMRKHARSWLIKVALGGIIIVFIFWYGWSGPGDQRRNYAASVNGTIISDSLFTSLYESEMAKLRLRFKGAIPSELLDKLNLKEKVLDSLVDQTLLMQEAQRLGMYVTTEDVVASIRSNPLFQRNGGFDPALYRAYLDAIRLPPEVFEDNQRRQLIAVELAQVLTDGVKTDPDEIKRLWHFQNDKLVLSALEIKPEPAKSAIDPTALESFFEKSQSQYEIPPTVRVHYVAFSWRDIAKRLSVSDQDINSYYSLHPKEFLTPERVRVRHILIKIPPDADKKAQEQALKKAQELVAKIKAGEPFEKVAKAESQDPASASKGGDIGFFTRGTMPPELEKVAFGLAVGKVSEPVLTRNGYQLMKVEEKVPEKQLELSEVKDKIRKKLLEEKAKSKLEQEADDFYDQVYRSEKLKENADKFGFEVKDSGLIAKGGSLPEMGTDPTALQEAFLLKTGEISKLLRIGDNYVVMKLVEKNKERVPALDEVRKTVEKDYLKALAIDQAKKKAEEIIEALKKDPNEADAVAARFGLKWDEKDPVSRTAGLIPGLGKSSQISEMLTNLTPVNPVFAEPLVLPDKVSVVRLVRIDRASDEKFAKEAPEFEKWVVEVRKTDFLKGWVRRLREKAQIDINRRLL